MREDRGGKFSISAVVRFKHGALRDALLRRGWSARRAAKFLGVNYQWFLRVLNLKVVPRRLTEKLEVRFFKLTGLTSVQLWPEEVFSKEFLEAPKVFEVMRDVPLHVLAGRGLFQLPPAPDVLAEHEEFLKIFEDILTKLPQEQANVLRRIILDGETVSEIAEREGLLKQTVSGRFHSGLRKMMRFGYGDLKNLGLNDEQISRVRRFA